MSLPEIYNTRVIKMWDHIRESVSFFEKTVLDVGCGRGDLAMRAWKAGAQVVFAIDNSKIELTEAKLRALPLMDEGAKIYFIYRDIEDWSEIWPGHHDIAICTSVIPYVIDPNKLLENICRDSDVAVIECQYAGDGPGLEYIKNDYDMRNWLDKFDWKMVEKIGYTVVKSRNAERSIWKCTK